MVKAPCKGCTFETGRSIEPNCHTYCEKFLKYKEEVEKEKADLIKEACLNQILNDIEKRRIKKASTGGFYRSRRTKK